MIVLDSSAACDMVRKTEEGMAFRALMLSEEKVISCELLRAEVVSIFRKLCRHGFIPIEKVQSFLTESTALVNEYYSIQELQEEVLSESIRLDHSSYDMFYFVLALPFWRNAVHARSQTHSALRRTGCSMRCHSREW